MNNKDQNGTKEKLYNNEKPKPYYKVGNPYYINGIKYIPKEVSSYYEKTMYKISRDFYSVDLPTSSSSCSSFVSTYSIATFGCDHPPRTIICLVVMPGVFPN